MGKIWMSGKAWGGATIAGDKVKAGKRKPRDASEGRRWAKNKGKAKPISRKAAAKFNQPF